MDRSLSQADLFEYIPSGLRPHDESGMAFLERHRVTFRLDQLLMLTIVFIVLGSVAFGFGMENGRHLTVKAMAASSSKKTALKEQEEAQKAMEKTQKAISVEAVPDVEIEAPATADKQAESGKYTIQLVTYLTRQSADQQIQRLKNQGLEGFVVPRGQYLLVCVNAFETRNEASRLLTELKSKGIAPSDAYIRAFPA